MAIYDVSTTEKKAAPSLVAGGTLYADSPIGTILPYGGASAPSGWFLCDGTAISRTTFSELFAVIGESFGAGDGSTTFNLPNMAGKTAVGASSGVVLGTSEAGALPNIKGSLMGRKASSTANVISARTTDSGAFSNGTDQPGSSVKYLNAGTTEGVQNVVDFDASTYNSIYKDGLNQVTPANVRVNYIIKAKMVGVPADFLAKVDEVLDAENILWENQSPDSNFSAQDVTLANDNYRYLTIYYKEYAGRNYYLSVKFPKGAGCYLNKIDTSSNDYYVYNRICSYTNSTKLHFDNAYQSSQSSANNGHCIPIKIVGSMT